MKKLLFGIICSLLFISSCYKPDETVVYDPDPLKAKVLYSSLGHHVSWKLISPLDFIEFRVWKSAAGDSINPQNLNKAILAFKSKVDTVFDENQKNDKIVNYRVEAVLQNRSLWSKNVKVIDDRIELKQADKINELFQDSKTNLIYLIADKYLEIFDNEKEIFLPQKIFLGNDYLQKGVCFGDFEGRRELYIGEPNEINVYNATTLSKLKTFNFNNSIDKFSIDNKNRFLVNSYYDLMLIDRKNGKTISSIIIDNPFSDLKYLPIQDKYIALDDTKKIMYIRIDKDVNIKIENSKTLDNLLEQNGNSYSNIQIFPTENHYVIGNQLTVLDRNFVRDPKINPLRKTFDELTIDQYPLVHSLGLFYYSTLNALTGKEKERSTKGTIEKMVVCNDKKWIIIKTDNKPYKMYFERLY